MSAGRDLRSVCVYCGSSPGADPAFAAVAGQVGALLAGAGIRLVYGGGAVGLMGTVADAALAAGGEVVGVIPRGLFRREVAHPGLTELVEVRSMHERKQVMFDRSDAFVALPGGIGTVEELVEVATWAQLGISDKPVATLDVAGYWRPLHALLRSMADAAFLREDSLGLVADVLRVDDLLPVLRTHRVPAVGKWIDLDEA
ncbi:MAG TPA: TIGR00730 family Rossman fold protein [Acidimicrobiales bacterium]